VKFTITPEIARIHAHVCGDGFIYTCRYRRSPMDLLCHPRINVFRKDWILAYSNTCEQLINEFVSDLMVAFNRKGQYRKKHCEVRITGAKHIVTILRLSFKSSYNWYIPDFILKSSKEVISNWIRAFFDDEAHVDVKRGAILVTSINKKGLCQILRMLLIFKINSKIYGPYRNRDKGKEFWRLRTKDIYNYSVKIGFLHPKKKGDLEKIKWGKRDFHSTYWLAGTDLNTRHHGLQPCALPG
jgi:hypothetical protein